MRCRECCIAVAICLWHVETHRVRQMLLRWLSLGWPTTGGAIWNVGDRGCATEGALAAARGKSVAVCGGAGGGRRQRAPPPRICAYGQKVWVVRGSAALRPHRAVLRRDGYACGEGGGRELYAPPNRCVAEQAAPAASQRLCGRRNAARTAATKGGGWGRGRDLRPGRREAKLCLAVGEGGAIA